MAYFAASQIAIYLAEELGFDKVVAHLPLWADGKQTSEVVKNALGIEADELDRRFRAWLEPRLERYREQYVPDLRPPNSLADARAAVQSDPKNASKLAKLALALFGAGQNAEAAATLELALQADPKHADALYLKLRMSMALKKLDDEDPTVQLREDGA